MLLWSQFNNYHFIFPFHFWLSISRTMTISSLYTATLGLTASYCDVPICLCQYGYSKILIVLLDKYAGQRKWQRLGTLCDLTSNWLNAPVFEHHKVFGLAKTADNVTHMWEGRKLPFDLSVYDTYVSYELLLPKIISS